MGAFYLYGTNVFDISLMSGHELIPLQQKGAVPLTTIKAHTARIYGIDWSRKDRDQIVTCSLDQSIKFWNTSTSDAGMGDAIPRPLTDAPTHVPRKRIDTRYPIWRARHVPFGNGVLSLPQRGIQRPELFYEESQRPIEIGPESGGNEGQVDIVKEYVWRTKGGVDTGFGRFFLAFKSSITLVMLCGQMIANFN
jgi:SEA/GATOR complex protein SEA3/WDR59